MGCEDTVDWTGKLKHKIEIKMNDKWKIAEKFKNSTNEEEIVE